MNVKSNITSNINEQDGIVLNEQNIEQLYGGTAPTSKKDLVDVESLTLQLVEVMEFMALDSMLLLKEKAPGNYSHMVEEKFPEFTSRYYGIFQLLLRGDADIEQLIFMLQQIESARHSNQDILDIDYMMKGNLKKKFVYPKLSRKEARKLQQYDEREFRKEKKNRKK